jgi:hypothetical protein
MDVVIGKDSVSYESGDVSKIFSDNETHYIKGITSLLGACMYSRHVSDRYVAQLWGQPHTVSVF